MGMRKFLSAAERRIDQISEIFGVVAVVVLVCMMMLTVCDVCLRYFFNRPIMASAEVTEYMMVMVGFLGLAWCAVKGMHIKVQLIVGRFSERAQGIVDTINHIIVVGLCVIIAWRSFSESLVAREMGRASEITGTPHYPFYLIVVLGYILLLLIMIPLLVQAINKVAKR
jgi:TRAP-type C4-dicarboxylate transport system permease small subunit